MSTLLSLDVTTSKWSSNFWDDWDKNAAAAGFTGGRKQLSALRSLDLTGFAGDAKAIKSLHQAIDFTQLHELEIGNFEDPIVPLFESLTKVAQESPTGMSMRRLHIRMSDNGYGESPERLRANLEARCRFISSFDSLTSLDVHDHGQYDQNIAVNPGLPDILLQAILKHKTLTTLKISYSGIICGKKIPYISAQTVGAIIKGLPRLREFEFPPQEAEIVSD
jgi:hypothetical protein